MVDERGKFGGRVGCLLAAVDGVVDVCLAVVEGGEEALPVGRADWGLAVCSVHVWVGGWCRVGAEGEVVEVCVGDWGAGASFVHGAQA